MIISNLKIEAVLFPTQGLQNDRQVLILRTETWMQIFSRLYQFTKKITKILKYIYLLLKKPMFSVNVSTSLTYIFRPFKHICLLLPLNGNCVLSIAIYPRRNSDRDHKGKATVQKEEMLKNFFKETFKRFNDIVNKTKICRQKEIKHGAETNGLETKKTIQKVNERKSWDFEKINKIN